jgi:hypothetical protein
VAWLALAGCTIEQGGADEFAVMTSGMTTTTETSDSDDATLTSSTSATTSVADSSGGEPSTSSADGSTTGSSTGAGSTGEVGCGNGVAEGDEECDDGNDDDFDECTSTCTIPVCDDGMHNGDETDVDCGGTCQGCALCEVCVDAADCDGDMICDDGGQCIVHYEMEVDWVQNCPSQAQGVTIEGLPMGTYRATAGMSAGTIWLPPHNPPTTGFFYETECSGVTFQDMHTPEGVRYINVAAAFNAMVSETETFDFLGGDITCWQPDNGCDDNAGSVAFSLDYLCR